MRINGGSINDAIVDLNVIKSINKNYTDKKFIVEAINRQDLTTLRDLSMVYYKTSGIYQRSVKYLSTLYRYDWLLIPYMRYTRRFFSALKVLIEA